MSSAVRTLGLLGILGVAGIGYLAIDSADQGAGLNLRPAEAVQHALPAKHLAGSSQQGESTTTQARVQVAALEPATEKQAAPGMSREQILQQAGVLFRVRDRERDALMAGFGSLLGQKGLDGTASLLGRSLTEEQFRRLREIEEPFNGDLSAIGQLYLDDLDYAKRDIWSRRAFHFEEPLESGAFRPALAGESRVQFPGNAIYFRLDDNDYPHLKQHLLVKHQIESKRMQALQSAQL